jgi:hypothetical protein
MRIYFFDEIKITLFSLLRHDLIYLCDKKEFVLAGQPHLDPITQVHTNALKSYRNNYTMSLSIDSRLCCKS